MVDAIALCACNGDIAPVAARDGGASEASAQPGSVPSGNQGGSAAGGSTGVSPSPEAGTSVTPPQGGSVPVPTQPCPASPAGGSGIASGGTPITLATLPSASGIVVDAVNAYVSSYEIGNVYAMPLDGGAPVTLDAIGQNNVAINSTGVFTVAGGGGDVPQGIVVGCAKTGCNGQYTTLATGQNAVWGVAADDQNVYWTNQDPGGAVGKAPVGGGPVTILSTAGPAHQIIASAGVLYYIGATTGGAAPEGLLSLSVDGGTPHVIVPPDPNRGVMSFTVDCTNAYYATSDGAISQVPLAGGAPLVLATGQGSGGLQMAVDATHVYFTDIEHVKSVPIGGGPAATLATEPSVSSVAVDSSYVYWTLVSGAVMKLAK